MEIVYKKIGELKPYENNPRKNDEKVYVGDDDTCGDGAQ